ncbi:hypothetical protein PPERSA_08419 [Pseudocohnilembus persalinus]|uniref:Uncharacterized protein n=1 Tax=Pseudocohnilembus persalinus TaxID=266149 RepID=A0A0V0R6N2_PSEPJ|nr:hypothetical protein PPERSA_08419 [Pseudocohnilembus persalinus]|eukprot:KRX10016.1 hypothetical protein PPERSA_08419 [Pseudocohnilembus persalinus]
MKNEGKILKTYQDEIHDKFLRIQEFQNQIKEKQFEQDELLLTKCNKYDLFNLNQENDRNIQTIHDNYKQLKNLFQNIEKNFQQLKNENKIAVQNIGKEVSEKAENILWKSMKDNFVSTEYLETKLREKINVEYFKTQFKDKTDIAFTQALYEFSTEITSIQSGIVQSINDQQN